MKEIYFEFNPKEMSLPQAINRGFQKAGRWYDIVSLEIKRLPNDAELYFYRAEINRKK